MDSDKHILITGSNGFVASHLIPALRSKGYTTISGVSLEKEAGQIDSDKYFQADICSLEKMKKLVQKTKPEIVFHLAALLKDTAKIPVKAMQVNFDGTLNILEALRLNKSNAVFHFAGSCLEYGQVQEKELPIKENTPLHPYNPYGASKAAAEMIAVQYHALYGVKTLVTRAFHHVGPGKKGEALVCNEWSKKIALIESGELAELKMGNPEIERDFLDVRDIVQAYILAVEKCDYGTPYNICSGKSTSLGKILEILKSIAEKEIALKENCFGSGIEPLKLFGDNSKFVKKTGWKQKIELKESLKDTLDFWRERIKDL